MLTPLLALVGCFGDLTMDNALPVMRDCQARDQEAREGEVH
jgi:hypothetical protein